MKLTITKKFITNIDKQKNPLVNKYGAYSRVALKTKEHGDKWLSAFMSKKEDLNLFNSWKEGDVIELDIEKKGDFLNFKLPDNKVSRQEFDLMKQEIKFCKDELQYFHDYIDAKKEEENKVEGQDKFDLGHLAESDILGEPPEEDVEVI